MEGRGSRACQNLEGARRKLALIFDYFVIYIKLKKVAPVKSTPLPRGYPVATAASGKTSAGRWKCGELPGAG